MKQLLILILTGIGLINAYSQQYDVDLNFPESPTSPAFIVMGVSPSEIESPATPSDLMFSVQNSSEEFTAIPQNYFLSLAPFWMFSDQYISYDEFSKGSGESIGNNIIQSLQISIGIADSVSLNLDTRRIGAGFNFSLLRGDINREIEDKYFDKLKNYNQEVQKQLNAVEKDDPLLAEAEVSLIKAGSRLRTLLEKNSRSDAEQTELQSLQVEIQALNTAISDRRETLYNNLENQYIEKIKAELKEIKLTRTGFYLNLAGGLAWNFSKDETTNFYRGGVWLNTGYQTEKNNWIAVARILSHQELTFESENAELDTADFTAIDLGLKLDYHVAGNATLSGEVLYRTVPNTDIKSSYRAVLNLSYNVAPDIQLNLTYGKDFDTFLTGESQYITLLSLALGIGQSRKLELR